MLNPSCEHHKSAITKPALVPWARSIAQVHTPIVFQLIFFNVLGSSVSLLHVTHFSTLWRGENLLEPASCKIIWTQMIAYAWCLPRHLALPLLKCFLLCSSLNIVCLISPFSLQGPHVFASRPNHLYYYPQFLHIFYYWLCEIEDEGQIVSRSLSPAYLSYAFW